MAFDLFTEIRAIQLRQSDGSECVDKDHKALLYGDVQYSYGELFEKSEALSDWMGSVGVSKGSIVASIVRDPVNFLVLQLACIRSRIVFAPISPLLTEMEKHETLDVLQPRFVIVDNKEQVTKGGFEFSVQSRVCDREWKLTKCCSPRSTPDELKEGGFIRFSSGTTGGSKGVCISLQSAWNRVQNVRSIGLVNERELVLCALPLHFHFVVSVLLFLVKRAVLFLPTATTGSFVSLLAHNDIDVVYGAPFHVELINQSAALRGKKLRRVISTSMALSDECAQNFYERFNFPLVQVLGNIEIGLPFVNLLWSKEQPTALGERVPGYEIKLVSVAGVHAVGSVICGELLIRGEGMFDCYLDPYRSRLSVCYDGWFATGDVLAMDSQGCYRFVGRTKSVINVGGLKVFPEEVEACILATGLVEEVRVYGVEHQIYGERIVAEVVAGSFDELALRRKLKERLARYKLPSEFVELEALGKTATGKVLRRRAV